MEETRETMLRENENSTRIEDRDHDHTDHSHEYDRGFDHEHHDQEHDHGHHDHDRGHNHDHDYHDHGHHDHNHDHDHDHHDHHHHDPVSISHHEGATIAAMQGVIPIADYDDAEKHLAEMLREAGKQVTEAGGIIGHIKFVLTSAGKCGQISVTDLEENIRYFEPNSCRAEGVAIVFALEDDVLEKIMMETVGRLFASET